MATVYGTNRTLANTPEGSNIIDPGLLKGKVRVMVDDYTFASSAIGTIVELGEYLPKGARVIDVELMSAALGSSVTLIVGDYEDDNRYITATECNTANLRTRLNAIAGLNYEVDETTATATGTDRQIIVTTAGAIATGQIKLVVKYVSE